MILLSLNKISENQQYLIMKTFIFLFFSLISFSCRSEKNQKIKNFNLMYEVQNITIRSENLNKKITYSDHEKSRISNNVYKILQEIAESEEKISNESTNKEMFPSLSGSYIVSIEFKNIKKGSYFVTFFNLDQDGNIIIKRYSNSIEDKELNDYIKEIIRNNGVLK